MSKRLYLLSDSVCLNQLGTLSSPTSVSLADTVTLQLGLSIKVITGIYKIPSRGGGEFIKSVGEEIQD